MVDIESSARETANKQHKTPAPPDSSEESESKRSKHEYLAFRGTRHTRVGADFQVTALPTPGSAPQEDNAATSHTDSEASTGGVGEEPSSWSKDTTENNGANNGLLQESSKKGNDDHDDDDNAGL